MDDKKDKTSPKFTFLDERICALEKPTSEELCGPYAWWEDRHRVVKNSKWDTSDSGKVVPLIEGSLPVNFILTIVKDAASRPEVLAAYGSATMHEDIPPTAARFLRIYREYLRYKYGNKQHVILIVQTVLRKLANHWYESVDDPKLRADLFDEFKQVGEDDGVNYEC